MEGEFAPEVTGGTVVTMHRKLFHRDCVPETIVSDNGAQFVGREFREFLAAYGASHVKAAVYHPQGNLLVERFKRSLGHLWGTTSSKDPMISVGGRTGGPGKKAKG